MKLKKLVSAVAGVAMACVFAMGAFAAAPYQVEEAQAYLDANGISYTISDAEVDQILATFGTQAAAEEAANGILAQVRADPYNAESIVTNALAAYGVTLTDVSISVNANNTITGSATVNGKPAPATFAVPASADDHGEIAANKDENGNWHVDEATTSAASSVASSTNVIKATGDLSGVVLMAGVVVVAAVLGLAVRKSSSIG